VHASSAGASVAPSLRRIMRVTVRVTVRVTYQDQLKLHKRAISAVFERFAAGPAAEGGARVVLLQGFERLAHMLDRVIMPCASACSDSNRANRRIPAGRGRFGRDSKATLLRLSSCSRTAARLLTLLWKNGKLRVWYDFVAANLHFRVRSTASVQALVVFSVSLER
jgi:hypothetical protein